MSELLLRFLVGGTLVTAFAMVGEVLRPKSFAGLFGAAPSVALASLAFTLHHEGKLYASVEARSMILGAFAFLAYAATVSWVLRRHKTGALPTTVCLMPIWFVVAFSLLVLVRG